MPVTGAFLLADGTKGPTIEKDGTRTYKQRWNAQTDDDNMTGPQVVSYGGLPRKYYPHPDDFLARCISLDNAEQDPDEPRYWVIDYTYSTLVRNLGQMKPDGSTQQNPSFDDDNPLNQPPEITFDTKYFKEIAERDLDGKLIANAAGEPYELTIIEKPRLVMDIARNLPQFNPQLIVQIEGAVSGGPFLWAGPRKCKCEKLKASGKWQKNVPYVRVEGQFVFARDSDDWLMKKLNAGFVYWDAVNTTWVPIYLPSGQLPTRPVPLTADGTDYFFPKENPAGINFITFRTLDDADFLSIGLFDGF